MPWLTHSRWDLEAGWTHPEVLKDMRKRGTGQWRSESIGSTKIDWYSSNIILNSVKLDLLYWKKIIFWKNWWHHMWEERYTNLHEK